MGGGGVWRLGNVRFVVGWVVGTDGMDGSASALASPGLLRKADSRRVYVVGRWLAAGPA